MRRPWIAAAALVTTACATAGPVICGGCQGPHYASTGFPITRDADSVRVCIAGYGCRMTRHPHEFARYSQPLSALPASAAELDGRRLTVVVRSGRARWSGTATLRDVPAGGGTCDCSGGLQAEVALSRTR